MTHLWTVGFQVVNFLLLLFLLRRYLWKPVRATIDQRRKEIDDAAAGVDARAKAADESRVAYEAKVVAADHERALLLAGAAVELAKDRERVLAEARAAAAAELAAAREELDEERGRVAGELTDATLDTALAVARKLLGDLRGAQIAGAFLDRICDHLDGLPEAELASLQAEIEARPTIQVATAPSLDDAGRERLLARLASRFGAAVELDVVVDDALIAGAELRFLHARVGHSFQQGLAAARTELTARGAAGAGHPELITHEEIVDR
jgi:F-type H+-transporting ATPase subunit b